MGRLALIRAVVLSLPCVVLLVTAVPAQLAVPADFPTIQEAIDAAAFGDVVEVAPGVYPEAIDFLGKTITVRGTGGSEQTSIDASGLGLAAVTFDSAEGPETILDGFTITGAVVPGSGGGIVVSVSSPTILDCVMMGNTAEEGGGARVSENSNPVFVRCRFVDNAASEGSALRCSESSAPLLVNCIVRGNVASLGGTIRASGDSTPVVINGLIAGNTATVEGAVLRSSGDSSALFLNCTITRNVAAFGHVFSGSGESNVEFRNSIVWDHPVGQFAVSGNSLFSATFSDIELGLPGAGNLDVDPQFNDPVGPDGIEASGDEDYRLSSGSLCLEAGDDALLPLDSQDLDGDGETQEPLSLDLAELPRQFGVVDMGAYETQPPMTPAFIRGDANGDGVFSGLVDALFVLAHQFQGGPAPLCLEAADADGDGTFSGLLDGIRILSHTFSGGAAPPAPYPLCGFDPDPASSLGCAANGCP